MVQRFVVVLLVLVVLRISLTK